jgi:hypothetical protein
MSQVGSGSPDFGKGIKMNRYIVRVELYGKPSWEDYEHLHAAMERRDFERTIASDDGTIYDLPTAIYYRYTSVSLNGVLDEAKTAASSVWQSNGVLASQTTQSMWHGLRVHTLRKLA